MTTISITRKINVRDPSVAPAWFNAQSSGTWKNFASSALTVSGVGWSSDVDSGDTSNYRAIMTAWGGGILNTQGVFVDGAFVAGHWMVCFGGGPVDYAGNELYAFGPLESDTPAWKRLTDPTIPAPNDVARLGGYPVSRHTYDTLVYLPDTNQMLCFGAPGYFSDGSAFKTVDLFDFTVNPSSVNPWTTGPDLVTSTAGTISACSAYSSVTGEAWCIGRGNGGRLHKIDTVTMTYTGYAKDNPVMEGRTCKADIDTANNLLVFAPAAGTLLVQDLANPTSSIYQPTTTGVGPSGVGQLAFNYDAANGRFIVKGGGSQMIWFLTPGANPASGGDAWAWSSITPTGDTLGTTDANGIYGRTRLVSSAAISGIITIPGAAQNVGFYKF